MRWIFALLLLTPITSSLGINIDYPSEIEVGKEALIDVELINESGTFYDLKIDVILNDKRISRIKDLTEYKSSMYYLKDAIQNEGSFYIKVFEGHGNAELIIKLRDNTDSVIIFDGYEIEIIEEAIKEVGSEPIKKESIKIGEDETDLASKKREDEYKVETNEKQNPEENLPQVINLNPKTIKKDRNLEDKKSGVQKYSIIVFSVLLLILYIKKINKKETKNEFRY